MLIKLYGMWMNVVGGFWLGMAQKLYASNTQSVWRNKLAGWMLLSSKFAEPECYCANYIEEG